MKTMKCKQNLAIAGIFILIMSFSSCDSVAYNPIHWVIGGEK